DQIEQRIAGANQSVEARLLEPNRGQIFGALVRRQHRDLRLDLGRDDDARRAFLARARLDPAREVVAGWGGGLVDVAHVEHRYGGQEAEHAKGLLLLGLALDQSRRLGRAQQGERAVDEIERLPGLDGVLVVSLRLLAY